MTDEKQVIQDDSNMETNEAQEGQSVEKVDNAEIVEKSTSASASASMSEQQAHVESDEAARIRQSTEHKLSRKYEKEFAERDSRIAELEGRLKQAAVPPDDESIYDEELGWRPKNMSIEEYKERKTYLGQQNKAIQDQRNFIAPIEKRTSEISQKISDFQGVVGGAVRNKLISESMVLLAGSEDGGLEVLYELAKANSSKLIELQNMSEHQQARELWRLAWLRNNPPKSAGSTSADTPITPVNETGNVGSVDYENMDFRDGYKEFKRRKEGGG